MFERFTDRGRRVLVLAQEEARLLDHGFIGTEHILLGLMAEDQGIAANALKSMDITLAMLRERVEQVTGSVSTQPIGAPPFSPRAKKVLELSLRESLQLGHSYIGPEHLLLGLMREGQGLGATILVDLGADWNRVRQSILALMSEIPAEPRASQPTRGETMASGDDPSTPVEPRCPQCRSGLTDGVRYRTIPASSDAEGDVEPGLVMIDVVYCGRCGMTLHMFKNDGPIAS
jgi:ATP-dependent Clp protease ATP-binding subunit ClpC